MSGFQAEAVAMIKDGKVSGVILTKVGSGYMSVPSVVVSPPENGEVALLNASPPENDIYTINNIQYIYV